MLELIYTYFFPLFNMSVSTVSLYFIYLYYKQEGFIPKACAFIIPFLLITWLVYLLYFMNVLLIPAIILRPILPGLLIYPTLEILQHLRKGE